MHPNYFNIVLNGAWNPSIFNQDWLLKHVCEEGTEEITISFPVEDPTAPRKIEFNGLVLFPGRKQLIIQPSIPDLEGIKNCAEKVVKILNLLSHTPIAMCGINFAFEEENNLGGIFQSLNFSDRARIDDTKYRLNLTNSTRQFVLSDEHILNLTLSDEGSKGQLKFNFHYQLNNLREYCELLTSNHIEMRFLEAVSFCKDVYELEFEEISE